MKRKLPEFVNSSLTSLFFITQAANISRLWQGLGRIEPWLIVPLAALALLCLSIARIRRKKT